MSSRQKTNELKCLAYFVLGTGFVITVLGIFQTSIDELSEGAKTGLTVASLILSAFQVLLLGISEVCAGNTDQLAKAAKTEAANAVDHGAQAEVDKLVAQLVAVHKKQAKVPNEFQVDNVVGLHLKQAQATLSTKFCKMGNAEAAYLTQNETDNTEGTEDVMAGEGDEETGADARAFTMEAAQASKEKIARNTKAYIDSL